MGKLINLPKERLSWKPKWLIVLAFIQSKAEIGVTTDEVEAALGMRNCSPRISDLCRQGLIQRTDRRRFTRLGKTAAVYVAKDSK